MTQIKYGNSTVLATAVLLRKVRENLARLEEMNWDSDKSEADNLLTSHEDFFKLTELSDSLLELIDIDGSFVDEITRDGGDISVVIYDHTGDDDGSFTGLGPQLFTENGGIYRDSDLSSDWLVWYNDTKEEGKTE
tara:strand:+ start:1400 stop:1804 length:405 start_codon:yes stop_codon:yes gene_type:complete